MPSVNMLVFNALSSRIHTLPMDYPISWPNRVFTKPADGKYLEVFFIPNGSNRIFISSGKPHRNIGLLQITVRATRGTGESGARMAAGDIINHFPDDLRLKSGGVTVRVMKRPEDAGMLIEAASVQIPVTIDWECYA